MRTTIPARTFTRFPVHRLLPVVALMLSATAAFPARPAAAETSPAAQPAIHVSPRGDDKNPGTMARPLASLEAVRDAVRGLKRDGKLSSAGVTVWLHGGDYLRTRALELSADDSGRPDRPTIWRAWPGEEVRWLGGRRLAGFRPVDDAAILTRLDPAARPHVVQCDLRAQGISDFGAMASRGFGRSAVTAHCELFYDGTPMTLARWPNEGQSETIAGFPEDSAENDGHGGKIGKLEGGFFYAGDRPNRWKDTGDLWVHGYWAWDWANSYERVAKLDAGKRHVITAPPMGLYGFRKGQRIYFLNVLEELDQPGEWFLDRKSGMLYFWPPKPLDAGANVVLSLLDKPLARMVGVSDLAIEGVRFEATRAGAVEISGGQRNRIAGCTIRNIGNWGVSISGGNGHGVVGCDIFDTGDGGVTLSGGDRQTLAPGGHFVDNCRFARQGRWSKCYVPAVLMSGVGQRASHNLIYDHPHCAILFSGNEHRVEFNEIHHIALETGDVGAIYTGRDWTFRGNRIRYNYIHDTGGMGMGSMGVYMDDCVSGTEVFGNIFYKVHWAMFIGGGRDHQVINNIFVDCDPAVRADGRGLDKSPVWHDMVYDYMKKQMAAVPQDLYRRRYPALATLDPYYARDDGIPPEGNVIARNICVGKWLEAGWHANPEWLKQEGNFVGEEPGFVNAAGGDFRLKKDAPAWKIGFQAIPVEQIGPQPDAYRKSATSPPTAPANEGPASE
ncbi:MAG: right-handed parallel beta-helix repeat-containing protein [Pirellulales bacterium]